jgi:hypothetical protein
MDDLIVGKKYCCSDMSLERALVYKDIGDSVTKFTWNGYDFEQNNCAFRWKYWVLAEDETPKDTTSMEYWESVIKPAYDAFNNIVDIEAADDVEYTIWKDTSMSDEDLEAKGIKEIAQMFFRAGYLAALKGGIKK